MSDSIKAALAAKASKFGSRPVDAGLADELTADEPAKATPQATTLPAQAAKSVSAYKDAEGVIHARKGSKATGPAPENEIDFRAWRARGRNAAIHTKVRPEFRKMFYQGAAGEEKELCVVLEEMILARYGRVK